MSIYTDLSRYIWPDASAGRQPLGTSIIPNPDYATETVIIPGYDNPTSLVGAAVGRGLNGVAYKFPTASSSTNLVGYTQIANDMLFNKPGWILIYFNPGSSSFWGSTANFIAAKSDANVSAGWALDYSNGGQVQLGLIGATSNGSISTNAGDIQSNKSCVLIINFNGVAAPQIYVNGKLSNSSASMPAGATTDAAQTLFLGHGLYALPSVTNTASSVGEYYAVAFGRKFLNTTEILELNQNPYLATSSPPLGFAQFAAPGTVTITGQSLTTSQGIVTVPNVKSITGQSTTLSQGTVGTTAATIVSITGQSLTTSQGTVSIPGTATVSIAGQSLITSQGLVTVPNVATITGQVLTLAQGTLTVAANTLTLIQLSSFGASGSGILTLSEDSSFSAYGSTLTGTNVLTLKQPSALFSAVGGGALGLIQTSTFSATGTATVTGTLTLIQPAPSFSASGLGGIVASLTLVQQESFSGYSGGTLTLVQPIAAFSATGKTGAVGTLGLIQTSSFSAKGAAASVYGTLTLVQTSTFGTHGVLTLVQPTPSFLASSNYVLPGKVAYAMNIKTGETTAYTNFDFISIIRLGFNFYGVKADGIYLLSGTTDNGAIIDARIRTAQSYYSTNQFKQNAKVYIDTEDTTTVTPIIDNVVGIGQTSEYTGRKTSLGRGYKGKIWQWEIANYRGNPMRIGALEVLFDELSRRVGGRVK